MKRPAANDPRASAESDCASCRTLEAQLAEARAERDRALEDLARAGETVNALRLALPPTTDPPASYYPQPVPPGMQPPLRYRLVDRANEGLKRLLGPLHRTVKRVLERDGEGPG